VGVNDPRITGLGLLMTLIPEQVKKDEGEKSTRKKGQVQYNKQGERTKDSPYIIANPTKKREKEKEERERSRSLRLSLVRGVKGRLKKASPEEDRSCLNS